MKKILIVLFAAVIAVSANAQEKKNLFKSVYDELFKYGTIYVAGDIKNPRENPKDYFVRTNPDGNLYTPPVVVVQTIMTLIIVMVLVFVRLQGLIMKEKLKNITMGLNLT